MKRTACMVALVAAGCVPWPRVGSIDLPVQEQTTRRIQPRALEISSRNPPQSLEAGRRELEQRKPAASGEPPRVVREVKDQLTSLTVAELRLAVLRNNLDLDVALYDPAIAGAKVGAEVGRFDVLIGSRFRYGEAELPRINGPIVDFSSDDPLLDGQRAKLTEVEQRRRQLGLGLDLRLPLPTGGVVALDTLVDEKTITDPARYEQYLAATRFSLSQPLLRNAGSDAALAGIRIARTNERISQVRTKLAALRVLSRAEKSYWRLFAARRILDVRAEQFRLASENLSVVRRRVAEGITPQVEIARTEVGVYSRLEALVIAETAWRLQQRELKAFINSQRFPLRGGRMIDVASPPRLAGLDLDRDELVRQALATRLDLIELELQIVRNGLSVAYAENQVLPIVNLDFHYGVAARGSDAGQAWEAQWGFDHQDYGVGISLEIPLSNQRQTELRRGAILARSQRLASRRARELMVRTEVLNGVDVIERNWQRIIAARQNVVVAGVNYDAERRQFEQGLRTMREVLEALGDLGSAQLREVRAIVEYQVAQIDLAFASGTLLGYSRVDVDPLPIPRR